MTADQPPGFYTNPVYPHSFPDPYVLKFNGEYFAYCTGDSRDGKVFQVLRSRDLIKWNEAGGAMQRLDVGSPFYWAPEVTYWNGTFYLYYSVGNEVLMHVRVATSKEPDRGFEDAGVRLTDQDFAIDPHVFTDLQGERYLFYATDFLNHSHIGTGIVVDRMTSWHELAGNPVPVARAKYDWQVYDPQRKEKGGVRWHTVEGPFVLERKGRKYLMFSGGNWKQPSYGVGYASTDDIHSLEEWQQFCDGVAVAPVLRSVEQKLVGPGHNSVVRGPDNRQLYCVYHFWRDQERVLAINRMGFAGDRILVEDEPYLPKRLPTTPLKEFTLSPDNWHASSEWEFNAGTARSRNAGYAAISSNSLPESFLCELSFGSSISEGRTGFTLQGENERILAGLTIISGGASTTVGWECDGREVFDKALDPDFDLEAIHLVRIDVNFRRIHVAIPDANLSFSSCLPQRPEHLVLFKDGANASFSAVEITAGFEDLFEDASEEISADGWKVEGGPAKWRMISDQLIFRSTGKNEAILRKGEPVWTSESLIVLKLTDSYNGAGTFGFVVIDESGNHLQRLVFSDNNAGVYLSDGISSHIMPLPEGLDLGQFHQYSFYRYGSVIEFGIDTQIVQTWDLDAERISFGIFAAACELAIDSVRVTNSSYGERNGS